MHLQSSETWRAISTIYVVAAVALLVLLPDSALGQDSKTAVTGTGDTFPAALGYAALSAAAVVWGTMSAVVGKLYYGREQDKKDAQAQIDLSKKDSQSQIDGVKRDSQSQFDALRKECREEIARLRDRLEVEQKERREEAEKLLREQKDIMREVMVTCSAISDALRKNTETLERMTQAWKEGS